MSYTTSEEGKQGLPELTAKEIQEKLERKFRGNKTRPTPMLILGKAGVGKTQIIYQVVKKLGIGLKEVVLTEYDSTDLAGLPRIMDRRDIEPGMRVNNESDLYMVEHIRPRLLPDPVQAEYAMKKYCEMSGKRPEEVTFEELPPEARQFIYGILFFDEVPAACEANRVAASKLLDKSRRIGDYVLPERWVVVCAGNGPEDAGVYDNLEGMFFNRCDGMRFEPSDENWISWAVTHNVHPAIISFIKTYPEYLWNYDPNATYSGAFPSPRAWENSSIELLDFLESKPEGYIPTEREVYINIAGIVGTEAANKFCSYFALSNDIIPVSDIENGTARTNVNDSARDAAYLQASIVAARVTKRAAEYNSAAPGTRDFTKLKNLLNWSGKFIQQNLDAGTELIRECLPDASAPLFIMLLAQPDFIKSQCPDFYQFYVQHQNMYRFT